MPFPFVPDHIIADLNAERARQEQLRESGKFTWTLAHPKADDVPRKGVMDVLCEELGEVSRARLEDEPGGERRELIELAACCISRVSYLDFAADARLPRSTPLNAARTDALNLIQLVVQGVLTVEDVLAGIVMSKRSSMAEATS